MDFAIRTTIELLNILEAKAGLRYEGKAAAKEWVFNRVRVLRAEGYAPDVALNIAMKERRM